MAGLALLKHFLAGGDIALGERCSLSYTTAAHGVVLQPNVATMRETIFAWGTGWRGSEGRGLFPDELELSLVDGFWHVAPNPALAIDGKTWRQPMMLRIDDRLVINGIELEVRR